MKQAPFTLCVCALSLAFAAALAGLCFVLLGTPAPLPLPERPAARLLDEGWAAALPGEGREEAFAALAARTAEAGLDTLAVYGDTAAGLGSGLKALQKAARAEGLALCLLARDEGGRPLSAGLKDALPKEQAAAAEARGIPVLYGDAVPDDTGLTVWRDRAGLAVLLAGESVPARLAAAVQTRGTGVLLGDPDEAENALCLRFLAGGADLPDLSIQHALTVAWPTEGDAVYADTVTLCGTAAPGEPVTVNGLPAELTGSVWALPVTLTEGENAFTVEQAGRSVTRRVTLRQVTYTPAKPTSDGTLKAVKGQWLRTTSALTSLLTDPLDSSSIAAGLPAGSCAPVAESRRILKGSKYTTAYRVEGGGWVLAADCELLPRSQSPAPCVTAAVRQDAAGGDVVWRFICGDLPVALARPAGDGGLEVTLLGASFDAAALPAELSAAETAEGCALTLPAPAAGLYGWDIAPCEGGFAVTLAAPPAVGGEAPLSGLRVLLDPGHGGTDTGAAGCAGEYGPEEKTLNLALAVAVRTRLEQLGAEVTLTRGGDDTLTLAQRRAMTAALAPDVFLSLHHNSAGLERDNTGVGGIECYYFTDRSAPLAEALGQTASAGTGRPLRRVVQDYYYVTRTDLCPAVLFETGFLTTGSEYADCADPETVWATAGLIAQAVLQVFG